MSTSGHRQEFYSVAALAAQQHGDLLSARLLAAAVAARVWRRPVGGDEDLVGGDAGLRQEQRWRH